METQTPTSKNRDSKKVWNRAKRALERGRSELTRISKVGRLKLSVTKIQRDRSFYLKELGQKAHDLVKEGHLNPEKLEKLVAQIDSFDALLEEHKRDIEEAMKTQAQEAPTTEAPEDTTQNGV